MTRQDAENLQSSFRRQRSELVGRQIEMFDAGHGNILIISTKFELSRETILRTTRRTLLLGAAAATAACGLNPELDISDLEPYPAGTPADSNVDLSAFLDAAIERSSLPALGAIVVTSTSTVASGFCGVRDHGAPSPVSLEYPVHIGSLGKAMTSIVAAMLVEEGVLNWESTPESIIGDVSADPAWRASSLQQLLRMNGGASRTDEVGALFEHWLASPERGSAGLRQREELARVMLAAAPAYPPGSRLEYSNFSYALAGHMMERAAGAPFEDLVRQRLFEPLELTSAGFGAPAPVRGHTDGGEPAPIGALGDNPAMLSPAGRMHLSIPDYGRYMRFILQGAAGEHTLLTQAAFAELFTPFRGGQEAYAMGWEVRDDAGPNVTTLAHSGSNSAWHAYAWLVPERGIGIFAVTNQGGAEQALDAVVWRLVLAEFARR